MSEFTPGPWKWSRRSDESGKLSAVLLETEHRPIPWNDPCITAIREDWIHKFREDTPDARLIIAAPDMKQALEAIARCSEDVYATPADRCLAMRHLAAAGLAKLQQPA